MTQIIQIMNIQIQVMIFWGENIMYTCQNVSFY